MNTTKQAARRLRIEEAAYAVLREAGYKGASMLTIAKRASASNETLYSWYGNKQALFRSLVETNASRAKLTLEEALQGDSDAVGALAALGPILLSLVTSERAIILNRAAAGDVNDTGTLGRSIADAGRNTIFPLLTGLLDRARQAGLIAYDDPDAAAETYLGLLIGDLQIRRVIGVLDELTPEEIARRSQRALDQFLKLYPADGPTPPDFREDDAR